MKIEEVEISKIKPNPYQTRIGMSKEPMKVLVRSILKRGLINPISVLKENGNYIIISGHRRLRACKSLRWKKIPSIVKDRQKNNELVIDLVHENLVREDLTPIEKALSLKLLFSKTIPNTKGEIDKMLSVINMLKNYNTRGYVPEHHKKWTKGLTDDDTFKAQDILKSLGFSENNAYLYLTLLKLPFYIQKEICYKRQSGEFKEGLSVKMGEQLARIKDVEYQKTIFERARYNRLTSRHIQALADDYAQKVERGEWKVYVPKNLSQGKFKDNLEVLKRLFDDCHTLSGRLASFRVNILQKLEITLEKNLFISSLNGLKKELEVLRNRIDEKLAEKGFREIKNNIEFEIMLTKGRKSSRYEKRFTFPTSITKELNLPSKKVYLKVKIIGVKI